MTTTELFVWDGTSTDAETAPWWVERCYGAWANDFWRNHASPPFKKNKHEYGR